MPLAVSRWAVKDLPVELTLDDSSAMMDQFGLSRFDEAVVNARVSKSGRPQAQPGNLSSDSVYVRFEEPIVDLDLTIDERVVD